MKHICERTIKYEILENYQFKKRRKSLIVDILPIFYGALNIDSRREKKEK